MVSSTFPTQGRRGSILWKELWAPFRSPSDLAWTLLLGSLSCLESLIATWRGPGLSPDSTIYLSSGINLFNGKGFTDWSGAKVTHFPPAVPAVVGAAKALGFDAYRAIALFNAVAFFGITVLAVLLVNRHVANGKLRLGAGLFIATSAPLLNITSMAWSEPLFIVLVLLFILMIENILRHRNEMFWAIFAGVTVWLAFLTRYAAVALIPVGLGSLLLDSMIRRTKQIPIRTVSLLALIPPSIPLAWMIRNWTVDGTLMGPRNPSIQTPFSIFKGLLGVLAQWLAPFPVRPLVAAILGLVVLALIVAPVLLAVVRSERIVATGRREPSLIPVALFIICYSTYLVLAEMVTAIDGIDSRLMSPLLVPLVVLLAVAVDRSRFRRQARIRVQRLLTLIVAIGVTASILTVAKLATQPQGFAAREWRDSELIQAVRDLAPSAVIYSNYPDAIWAVSSRQPVYQAPLRTEYPSRRAAMKPRGFLTEVACHFTYLAWFSGGPAEGRPYVKTPSDLTRLVRVHRIQKTPDGSLYRLTSARWDRRKSC